MLNTEQLKLYETVYKLYKNQCIRVSPVSNKSISEVLVLSLNVVGFEVFSTRHKSSKNFRGYNNVMLKTKV